MKLRSFLKTAFLLALAGGGAAAGGRPAAEKAVSLSLKDRLISRFDRPLEPYPATPEAFAKEEAIINRWMSLRAQRLPPPAAEALREALATGISVVDLFHGSLAAVPDGGARYRCWSLAGKPHPSTALHLPSTGRIYEVPVPRMGALVFGVVEMDSGVSATWFQVEAFGAHGLWAYPQFNMYKLRHVLDACNVGPMGLSPYNEARRGPLVLRPREPFLCGLPAGPSY